MKKASVFTIKNLFWAILTIIVPLLGACGKAELFSQDYISKLVIYDKDGNVTNTLIEGDDFMISLEIINNTGQTILRPQRDHALIYYLYDQKECLLIYQQLNGGKKPVGHPFDPSSKPNFPDINLPQREVKPQELVFSFGYPWSYNADNGPLKKGKYFSAYKDKIEINGSIVGIDASIEFEVK